MIRIIRKSYGSAWQNISVWDEQKPFLPPWGKAEVQLEFVSYALHSSREGTTVELREVVSPLALWDDLIGRVVVFYTDTDAEAVGFEVGAGQIGIKQGATEAWYNARFLQVEDSYIVAELTARISGVAPPYAVQPETVAFFQDHTAKAHYATLTNASQASSFTSPITGLPPSAAHADSLQVSTSVRTGYAVNVAGFSSPISINSYRAVIQVYNFLSVLTQLNLRGEAPQRLYETELALLFGRHERDFVALPLSTCELNLYQNNTRVAQAVSLSGTNGAWMINASGVPAARYVALHNDTAAHTAAIPHAGRLLQTDINPTFTIVPPNPRAIGVAVYYEPARGWGVRVSANAISILPPPTPDFELIPIGTTVSTPPNVWATHTQTTLLRPWDALAAHMRAGAGLTRVLRFWAVFRLHSGAEFLLEEWSHTFPPHDTYPANKDLVPLYHFAVPDDPFNVPHIQASEIDAQLVSQAADKSILRTYLAKYIHRKIPVSLPLVPDTLTGLGKVILACLAETSAGLRYAETEACAPHDITDVQWTTQGTWSIVGGKVRWNVVRPENVLQNFLYRCACFAEEISAYPLFQGDNAHTDSNISVQILTTVVGSVEVRVEFAIPQTPGRYIFFVRLLEILGGSYGDNLAEYYELVVPPPLPVPPPRGAEACPPCTPVAEGERYKLLFPEPPTGHTTTPAGDWYQYTSPPSGDVCFPAWHCGLHRVSVVPAEYVDLRCEFDNRVWDYAVQGEHWVRAIGILRRLDDAYTVERYITRGRAEEDILRTYKAQYEVELFLRYPCELFAVELAKYARRIRVIARRGMIRDVDGLVAEDFAVTDLGSAYKVRIKLRTAEWRKEYRY